MQHQKYPHIGKGAIWDLPQQSVDVQEMVQSRFAEACARV